MLQREKMQQANTFVAHVFVLHTTQRTHIQSLFIKQIDIGKTPPANIVLADKTLKNTSLIHL